MSRGIRATGLLGSLVAVLAVVVLWWQPWSGESDPAREWDYSQDFTSSELLEMDDTTSPEVQRDSMTEPDTEGVTGEDADRPTATVQGKVRAAGSRRTIRGGTVELAYVDPVAEGSTLEVIQAMEEEERSWLESFDEAPIRLDGTFERNLPVGVILRRAILKPTMAGGDLFGGFLDTDVELGDRVLGPEGTTLDLEAPEGFVISGQVKDARTGLPVADARVAVVWWNLDFSLDGDRTDPNGQFRIGGLRPEVVAEASFLELQVRASGYVPLREKVILEDPGEAMAGVELLLTPGPSWVGTVVDAEGTPQEGAEVTLTRVRGEDPLGADLEWIPATRSDREGRFDLGALEPGREVNLFVRLPAQPAVLRTLSENAPPPDLRVTLPSTTWLDVQVTSDLAFDPESLFLVAKGDGPNPATWQIQSGRSPLSFFSYVRRGEPVDLWVQARTVESDQQTTTLVGTARCLPDQPEQEVPVSLHASDEATDPADGLQLTLRERSSRRVLTNTPLSVSEAHRGLWNTRYVSGAEGELTLDLPPGRHFLVVRSPGYVPRFLQVDLDWPGPRSESLFLQPDR